MIRWKNVLRAEPQIGLMEQVGRAQRVVRALAPEMRRRAPAELGVHHGHELVARAQEVQGLIELATCVGLPERAELPLLASAIDFALEGLSAQKKISRSEEWRYTAAESHVHADELGDTFSDEMIERINDRLGSPDRCPHGWPVDT